MIETHAHIYDPKFDTDRDKMISDAQAVGITKILMPNCDKSTINIMLACEQNYPDICMPMMGLHPCYVTDYAQHELDAVHQNLQQRQWCAIGEIGLDYYWDTTFVQEQQQAFSQQMQWAIDYNLPIVVHSRESTQDCINMIKPFVAKGLKGVFHCFSGNVQEAKQLVDLGFYLGIGGVLTYKKSGLDAVVKEISMEHLLLETDAPYLAPVPHRGKRNEVSFMLEVAKTLVTIKEVSLQQVDEITTANAIELFKL
jgi:TatD DNase family protein